MIVDAILARYQAAADARRPKRGNPTGSTFGTCAAQLQLLRYPEMSRPEPLDARAVMVFESGDEIEAWWSAQIEEDYPAVSGLQQEPFYFGPIQLTPEQATEVERRIEHRTIWGRLFPGFVPPRVARENGKLHVRLAPDKKMGFILVPEAGTLWAPTYVDRIIDHPEVGLTVLEKKAMSNFGFRRALLADPGYTTRAQLAGEGAATGMPVALLAYKKDTAHLLEILYRPEETTIRVELIRHRRAGGTREVFFLHRQPGLVSVTDAKGEPAELPHPETWDLASLWTPFESQILQEIRERIVRVLLWSPDQEPYREYGPEFRCARCQGQGGSVCGYCAGSGKTAVKRLPCGRCQGTGRRTCEPCQGRGVLDLAALPAFPCGYCSVRRACWRGLAQISFEPLSGAGESRPRWMLNRGDVAGIEVHRPAAEVAYAEREPETAVETVTPAASSEAPAPEAPQGELL